MICLYIGIINHAEPAGTSGSQCWRCVGWDRYGCAFEGFDDKYECLGLWGMTGSIIGITRVCERETCVYLVLLRRRLNLCVSISSKAQSLECNASLQLIPTYLVNRSLSCAHNGIYFTGCDFISDVTVTRLNDVR